MGEFEKALELALECPNPFDSEYQVRRLLEDGADPHAKGSGGEMLIYAAARNQNLGALGALLEKFDMFLNVDELRRVGGPMCIDCLEKIATERAMNELVSQSQQDDEKPSNDSGASGGPEKAMIIPYWGLGSSPSEAMAQREIKLNQRERKYSAEARNPITELLKLAPNTAKTLAQEDGLCGITPLMRAIGSGNIKLAEVMMGETFEYLKDKEGKPVIDKWEKSAEDWVGLSVLPEAEKKATLRMVKKELYKGSKIENNEIATSLTNEYRPSRESEEDVAALAMAEAHGMAMEMKSFGRERGK